MHLPRYVPRSRSALGSTRLSKTVRRLTSLSLSVIEKNPSDIIAYAYCVDGSRSYVWMDD